MWSSLTQNEPSQRKEILHNIDDIWGSASVTVGEWKLLKGTNYNGFWDKWYGPAGNRQSTAYNVDAINNCPAGIAINKLKLMPSIDKIRELRLEASIECYLNNSNETEYAECRPLDGPCLFNVYSDPCELNNVAERYYLLTIHK